MADKFASLIRWHVSDIVRTTPKVIKKLSIVVMTHAATETSDYYIARVDIGLETEVRNEADYLVTLKNYADSIFVVNKHTEKVMCLWISNTTDSNELLGFRVSNTGKSIFAETSVAEWAGGNKYPGSLWQIDLATGNTRSKYKDGKDDWHQNILLKPESKRILRELE